MFADHDNCIANSEHWSATLQELYVLLSRSISLNHASVLTYLVETSDNSFMYGYGMD